MISEEPNAAAAFMANLSSSSSQVNEVHSDDNYIFDNVNHQLAQEMHQEEHLGFDDEYDFLTNTIPYKKLGLVRQEQGLVIQGNQRNAELLKENELLKSTLSAKDKSIEFLKSEKEKVLTDKKELVDSYLDILPESGFYTKLNAIKFVPQTELSREQAYWLNSQDHTPSKPVTPFVRKEYHLADIFTRALSRERIEFLINKLGMRSFKLETLKQLADEAEE
uniref:Integrase, catalytic region, zinc finger, CCHC-type, peptidase aspartic, catalytic n=1 Tax=Tanacetum cinerariifolium TaxID=118510 RepID=A0A6L2JS74_TANCI|nr:integrase, catalytic region, zinc finger, CCHC-type, peptidase aspartic, catalytic [Tanacetum cinerariifolium]